MIGIYVANDQAIQKWFWGPSLLWKLKSEWIIQDNKRKILQDDEMSSDQSHCNWKAHPGSS